MDAARQPARTVQFIGLQGQQPLQFQGITPVPYDVGQSLPDNTQQLFAQTQESINSAYQVSSSVIQSQLQSEQVKAQARAQGRSDFSGAVGAIAQAINAGLEMRQKAKEKQQAELQYQVEQEIRNRIIDLNQIVLKEGDDNGAYESFQQYINSISELDLPHDARSELAKLGFSALEEVTRRQQSARTNLYQQQRDLIVQNEVTRQGASTLDLDWRMSQGLLSPEEYMSAVEQNFQQLATNGNFSGIELLQIYNEQFSRAIATVGEGTAAGQQAELQRNLVREALTDIVSRSESLDEVHRRALIAEWDVRLSQAGVNVNLSNIVPSDVERLQEAKLRYDLQESFRDSSVTQLLTNDPQAREAMYSVALAQAITIRDEGRAQFYRDSDDPALNRVYEQWLSLQDSYDSYRESVEKIKELNLEQRQIEVLYQQIRRRENPTETLGPMTALDPVYQRLREIAGVERGSISPEEAEAMVAELAVRRSNVDSSIEQLSIDQVQLLERWSQQGIDITTRSITNQEAFTERVNTAQEYLRTRIDQIGEQFRLDNTYNPSTFNSGTGVTAPPVVPLYRSEEGLTFPAAANTSVIVTSEYGPRVNPVTGVAGNHYGIDFVIQGDNARVRTIQGGTVIRALRGDNGGFGHLVAVRTPSGHIEQYNHLGYLNVSVGQELQPGQQIAIMGNTGRSTGPHVDFMVYKPGTRDEQVAVGGYAQTTINPREYLQFVTNLEPVPRGAGRPPSQDVPVNSSAQDRTGVYRNQELYRYAGIGGVIETSPGVSERATNVYNNANPRRQQNNSISRGAYPARNNPDHNYGYSVLANDQAFRREIARVADRVNVPGQWLADIIEFESAGFQPAIVNGEGAVGLIQFHPTGGLRDVANWLGVRSLGQATARLQRMSRAEQMRYVERFIYNYGPGMGHTYETIVDLYGVINQGPSYWNRSRAASLNRQDNGNPLRRLIHFLGEDAGRRYNLQSRDASSRVMHVAMTPHCAECARQLNNLGMVLPHQQEIA